MTATVSSIHINGWFGDHDKLTGARWMVRRLFGRELDAESRALGLRRRLDQRPGDVRPFPLWSVSPTCAISRRSCTTWPAFITAGERGAGFAEVAAYLESRA